MSGPITLAIDIGGTGMKAALLTAEGRMTSSRLRVPTPSRPAPEKLVATLGALAEKLGGFDRISVGFPGVVRQGTVFTAPHLGTEHWHGFPLAGRLSERLGRPARVLNDADVQGLGVVAGRGLECVLTFGTGVGSSHFLDGRLAPHLELSQHPIHKGKTYDQYLGVAALEAKGKKVWNRRVERAIAAVRALMNFDRLYLGGGNARKIRLTLPPDVTIVENSAGITGGVHLWDPGNDGLFLQPQSPASAERPFRGSRLQNLGRAAE